MSDGAIMELVLIKSFGVYSNQCGGREFSDSVRAAAESSNEESPQETRNVARPLTPLAPLGPHCPQREPTRRPGLSMILRIMQIKESSASADNPLRDLHNSSYHAKAELNNCFIIHSELC